MDRVNLDNKKKITRWQGRIVRIYKKLDNEKTFVYNTSMKKKENNLENNKRLTKLDNNNSFVYNTNMKEKENNVRNNKGLTKLDNEKTFDYNINMKKVNVKNNLTKLESVKFFCYNIIKRGGAL